MRKTQYPLQIRIKVQSGMKIIPLFFTPRPWNRVFSMSPSNFQNQLMRWRGITLSYGERTKCSILEKFPALQLLTPWSQKIVPEGRTRFLRCSKVIILCKHPLVDQIHDSLQDRTHGTARLWYQWLECTYQTSHLPHAASKIGSIRRHFEQSHSNAGEMTLP